MRDLTPAPREERPALPDFAPVPRRCARHDGWTPDRQRAFIEALADTGSVSRACALVNMSTEGAYYLRRQPGADGFRAAWAAALDFGVARMKDIAFQRAVEGTLVPVITGGRLIGYRRIFNDRLLMFCLRHYGEDANGRRTTINYFSTRASAGTAPDRAGDPPPPGEGAHSHAEASTTTVRTVITGADPAVAPVDLDRSTALIDGFPAVALDDDARAEIARALDACAARRRAEQRTPLDEAQPFFAVEQPERMVKVYDPGYKFPRREMRRPTPASDLVVDADAFLESPVGAGTEAVDDPRFTAGAQEMPWTLLDRPEEMDAIEAAVAHVRDVASADQPPALAEPAPVPQPAPALQPAPGPDSAPLRLEHATPLPDALAAAAALRELLGFDPFAPDPQEAAAPNLAPRDRPAPKRARSRARSHRPGRSGAGPSKGER